MINFYEDLAAWWPLLATPEEYEPCAKFYYRIMASALERPGRTLLELGCGGGNIASFHKAHLSLTLTDLSSAMLKVSQELNPSCRHITADMRDMRLGETFDFVFAQDSLAHLLTKEDLAKAIHTAAIHCSPGGAVLFAPDHIRENYRSMTEKGGFDAQDGRRGLRYLAWSQAVADDSDTYDVDYVYVLRDGAEVEVVHESSREGVFPRDFWLKIIRETGLEAEVLPYDEPGLQRDTQEVFLCRKPS